MFPNMDAIGLALAQIFAMVERIAVALERIADALEKRSASANREDAIARWARGEGKHPDDE